MSVKSEGEIKNILVSSTRVKGCVSGGRGDKEWKAHEGGVKALGVRLEDNSRKKECQDGGEHHGERRRRPEFEAGGVFVIIA